MTEPGSEPPRLTERFEGSRSPWTDRAAIDRTACFDAGRFPNVVVATDGTVLALWGGHHDPELDDALRVRRSADGGATWEAAVEIAPQLHGGGAVVDETTSDVLAFGYGGSVDENQEGDVFRSRDGGETWTNVDATVRADARGNVPSFHMAEHGITLRRGPHPGRLLRPARVYRDDDRGYNTALYSDDGGATWHPTAPFPARGTGEGAVAELSDGRLYYNSRTHHFESPPYRHERQVAQSEDGGETWGDPAWDATLPDGPRYRGANGRGACWNGHFGMAAGLTRLPIAGADVLCYSNADTDGYQRRDLTVWASFDGGDTWPVKRRVTDGAAAYSSLAAGRPGTPSDGWLYLLYEHGELAGEDEPTIRYAGGTLARFTLPWLVAGERTGDGTVPQWVQAGR
jgi:sialidase-1